MAIGDIKVFGKTNANVLSDVQVEVTGRIDGDNVLKGDILSNIVGNIENTNAQVIENQIPGLQTQLANAVAQRKAKMGDPAVETVVGGVSFGTKFNQVKSRTLTDFANAGSTGADTSALLGRISAVAAVNANNTTKLQDIMVGTPAYDSMREIEDFIVSMKTDDDNTISGFSSTYGTTISALAIGGNQTKANGMIYVDENGVDYYRIYINGGALILEGVDSAGMGTPVGGGGSNPTSFSDISTTTTGVVNPNYSLEYVWYDTSMQTVTWNAPGGFTQSLMERTPEVDGIFQFMDGDYYVNTTSSGKIIYVYNRTTSTLVYQA